MKTVLVLSVLLCAAFAAPAVDEVQAPEAAAEAPKEEMAAVSEMKEVEMKEEVLVPEDPVPVLRNAHVEEGEAPEVRFNFCPDNWFSHGSRCFRFIKMSMSWFNAEEHCNSLGGHLASVSDPREYSYLQQLTNTAGQSVAWLGGFHLQDRWMWIDRKGFYYTNWNNLYATSSRPCLYLQNNVGWTNTNCGSTYHFICSRDPFNC